MYPKNRKPLIIAETAFNHEGDKTYLLDLIDAVSKTGVTHIKFQVLLDHDEFVSNSSESYALIKSWCFSEQEWLEIFSFTESKGLRLFLMPLDIASVDFCSRESVDYIEIHSVSFNDELLKNKVKESLSDKQLVFGLGGRTLNEILSLKNDFEDKQLLLMHGFQAFPSQLEDVKLARIKYLKALFPESTLGYADHSAPDVNDAVYSSMYAYQLGARVFEKHVTLKKERTDAQSAMLPSQLTSFIQELQRFETMITSTKDDAFAFTEKEINYRNRQKQVVAIKEIKQGELFDESNVALKMHTEQGMYTRLVEVVDEVAKHDYLAGNVIIK